MFRIGRNRYGGGADVDDWQDFQGTWQALWLAQGGRKMTAGEVRDTTLTIWGDRYTLRRAGHNFYGTVNRVDCTRRGGAVDFLADGPAESRQAWPGIYVLGDDELSICVAPPGGVRPTSFAARRGSSDSLYLFRRHVTAATRLVERAALGSGV
jgi:uncharacterized protein (TIGR03067 family)